MHSNGIYVAGLYLRLSKDDERSTESVSIGTQRAILTDFCNSNQYHIHKEYVDDGYSGLNFERPGFREMIRDIESGAINMVLTKDLSRLGRDYIMTGYYSEIYFPAKNVRYIALSDNVDSLNGNNEIAPFKNILNDMYAQDISRKVKNAKHQRAKQGYYIGSQPPFGYRKDSVNTCLIVDPEASEVVKLIFSLGEQGMGSIAIAKELRHREIVTPAVYKFQNGDTRFSRYSPIRDSTPYDWRSSTISQILNNRVYLGELTNLKTEVISCKTKKRVPVVKDRQIVIPNAHEAIISIEQFEKVKEVRAQHRCPAYEKRENLFRGKLYCECCGHPLSLTRKQLKNRDADIYLCTYHYKHPEICPQTHIIYHEVLYPYVLQQIRAFGQTMKKRKINSRLKDFAMIEELTPEILDSVIERIEIGHVRKKSRPGSVITIYWKV